MFKTKSLATAAILLGSVLFSISANAYPRATKRAELGYIKSVMESIYGMSSAELDDYIEQEYANNAESIQIMLTEGYRICDVVKEANDSGVSLEEIVAEAVSATGGKGIERRGVTVDSNQMAEIFETTVDNLCPKLY